MKKLLPFVLLVSVFCLSTLAAWDDCENCEDEDDCDNYRRKCFQADRTDHSRLHQEASWPTKNQDPLIDALMK